MSECSIDGKTTGDGYTLCFDCTEKLEYDLAEVSGVLDDLGAVVARKAKGAPSVGGGSSSNPLPLDLDAMAKGRHLRGILTDWALNVADDFDQPFKPASASQLSDRLRRYIDHIRKQDWAAEMKEEVRDALEACRRATDRADERAFAGMCPTDDCGAAVYTKTGSLTARCKVCTTEWDVADWRGRALDYAGFTSGTASQISRMLTDPATGEALPRGTIRSWASRGILPAAGEDSKGHPVYRLDDVRQVWAESKASAYGKARLKAV